MIFRLVLSLLVAGFLVGTRAEAAGVLGGQLFWTGGDVTIELIDGSASFDNKLSLYSATPSIFLMNNHDAIGTTVTLSGATVDVDHNVGDELIFGIYVVQTGNTFLMGPGSRNGDTLEHAIVSDLGGGVFTVGFEDIFGGGDKDYNDTVFKFTGAIQTEDTGGSAEDVGGLAEDNGGVVPGPATLLLLGSGLAAAAVARRRRG